MITTILFDLDGTIVDTNELIINTFMNVLEGKAPEPLTRERIIPEMGSPLTEQLILFSGQEEVEDLISAYREYNIRMHDELVREFPHVYEVIKELHASGIKLGVVTTKMRLTTEKALKLFGLYEYMHTLITLDDVTDPKPAPEGIRLAMSLLGAKPEETLMVGDTQFDLLAARNAGVSSAAVAWSLKEEDFLRTFNPTYFLYDMRDLLDIAGLKRDVH